MEKVIPLIRINPPKAWLKEDQYLKELLTHPWYTQIALLTSSVIDATHKFFSIKGLHPCVFPITTGSVSSPMGKGSDSLPVKIPLRHHEVFLADSMQFSLEVATRFNEKGAYYVMPTFRGEKTDARHLNEFVHAEAEIPGTHPEVMVLIEEYITFIIKEVAQKCSPSIERCAGGVTHLESFLSRKGRFPTIRYEDALRELRGNEGALEEIGTSMPNITSQGEKILLQKFGDFIWLTHLPWMNVPFYQAREEDTPFSLTGDLLAGCGEILGCGQRVSTPEELAQSLSYHEVEFHGYQWYAEMRKLSPSTTAGFGLGVERLVMWLTQSDDIRDCSLLYRDHDKIFFP